MTSNVHLLALISVSLAEPQTSDSGDYFCDVPPLAVCEPFMNNALYLKVSVLIKARCSYTAVGMRGLGGMGGGYSEGSFLFNLTNSSLLEGLQLRVGSTRRSAWPEGCGSQAAVRHATAEGGQGQRPEGI